MPVKLLDHPEPAGDSLELHALLCRTCFIPYVRAVMPWFQVEKVHCLMADYIERLAGRQIDRLMFSMAPRGSKSSLSSIALPSWWMGKFPSDKIMSVGYKTDLSRRFSRQTMGIIRSQQYGAIFPGVQLTKDAHAVGYWNIEEVTNAYQNILRGEYQASGVTAGIAGSGFNLGICDDLLSEQDKDSKLAKDRVWEWWGPGFYTRRQPEHNAIFLINTRWALDDISGRLIELGRSGGDKWEIVNVPAILDGDAARKIHTVAEAYGLGEGLPPVEEGGSFAPGRIPLKELERSKANMRDRDWKALYMGNPEEEEGNILKRKWWRLWPKKEPPECIEVFQTYDTAFEEHEKADYSAMTTWGIFEYKDRVDGRSTFHLILLGHWKKRIESPDLGKVVEAFCHGTKHIKNEQRLTEVLNLCNATKAGKIAGFHPNRILIENAASGRGLIKEMRRRKNPSVPVWPWTPPIGDRGKQMGKYARAQLGAIVMEQGAIWYMDREWAAEVIDECAKTAFDGSDESDDLGDTVVMALLFVRQTYRVEIETDINEDEERLADIKKPKRRFYGSGH